MIKQLYLFFLICGSLSAQTNFYADGDQLKWQKVFDNSISVDDLFKTLRSKKEFKSISITNGEIQFNVHFSKKDQQKFGYDWDDHIPEMVEGGSASGFIEFKDGKYRVTVLSLVLNHTLNRGVPTDISRKAIKNGQLKTRENVANMFLVYDKMFTDYFSATATPQSKEW